MKGICFKEPLFLLTVQGIKTQTRRIIKPQPEEYLVLAEEGNYDNCDVSYTNKFTKADWIDDSCNFFRPRYKARDVVYLKEPYILYHEIYQELMTTESGIQYAYKYGNNLSMEEITGNKHNKWENKLFMSERAARYFIKITGVRAERLQDISDADCIKEGISQGVCSGGAFWGVKLTDGTYTSYSGSPREAYKRLIEKINGPGTWDSNPFVWVYDYELTKHY